MASDSLTGKAGHTKVGQVRSMTGFAAERVQTGEGELLVSLRSVNHRGLDLHFHSGGEFAAFENEMRSLLKTAIRRGHVEVRLGISRQQEATRIAINQAALAQYVESFRQVAKELHLPAEPDLNALLSLRGVLADAPAAEGLSESFLGELLGAIQACAEKLNEHRTREGQQLCEEMHKQADEIESLTKQVAAIRQEASPVFAARLRERLNELLESASISEARLAEEAALLADRTDIQEEIVRLQVHTQELKRLLSEGGEVGKRLDFLLQEMNREANTTLAKSANAGEPGLRLTTLGLALKATIERIREQALNLE